MPVECGLLTDALGDLGHQGLLDMDRWRRSMAMVWRLRYFPLRGLRRLCWRCRRVDAHLLFYDVSLANIELVIFLVSCCINILKRDSGNDISRLNAVHSLDHLNSLSDLLLFVVKLLSNLNTRLLSGIE